MIPGRGFSFCSCERVFLTGFRMQEHRKILTYLSVSVGEQFIGRRTHNTPVSLLVRDSKLLVTNSTADEIDLHRGIVTDISG